VILNDFPERTIFPFSGKQYNNTASIDAISLLIQLVVKKKYLMLGNTGSGGGLVKMLEGIRTRFGSFFHH